MPPVLLALSPFTDDETMTASPNARNETAAEQKGIDDEGEVTYKQTRKNQ
jgi:hypothetical protein